MKLRTLLLPILVSLPVSALPELPALTGGQVVHWRGGEHSAADLPEDVPADAREAVAAWRRFAEEAEYRLDLSADGVVLLVHPENRGDVAERVALVDRVRRMFDEEVPVPERAARGVSEPVATAGADDDVLPEDPGGPLPEDPGVEIGAFTVATPAPSVYGAESREPGTGTAVLFVLRTEPEYLELVDELAQRHEYLGPWADESRDSPGFVLGFPLAAAFVLQADGQEEFDARNELINRAARVLLLRRFGELPNWVVHGWAWHVEIALRDSVYVFPYRSEFVFVTEHTDWDKDLRHRFRGREAPLQVEEFAGWRRGSWSDTHARVSWGVVEFLARHHTEALAPFLERLRETRDRESRVDQGDGTWKRERGYEVPAATQLAFLEELVGPDVLERLVEFFVDGDGYRPPRGKRRR